MDSHNSPNPESDRTQSAVIKVFGVGGGGCNAIEQMIASDIRDVEYKCVNTDTQALRRFAPENVIELGNNLTKGLGAGSNPDVGSAAAKESTAEIEAAIGDADMLFLAAGMGGGTGTGAMPLIASIAREMGVLTVAVVTEPFAFEGERRRAAAAAGLDALRECADSMIVVPNENLLNYLGPDVTLVDAFAAANDVVTKAVQSIAELITTSGLINVDFADVKTVMAEMGHAIMSTGTGMGEHRAEESALAAIKSPLLTNIDLKAAKGILVNITSSSDLSMGEFQTVGDIIRQITADDATVVIGTVFDDNFGHEMKVTVVATGLNPPVNQIVERKNDDIAAKLAQPTPTAKEKAEAEAQAAKERAENQTRNEAMAEAVAAEHERTQRAASLARARPTVDIEATQKLEHSQHIQAAPGHATPPPLPQQSPQQSPQKANAKTGSGPDVHVSDVCMICGVTNGRHLAKCPWQNGPTLDQKQELAEAQAKAKADAEERARIEAKTEVAPLKVIEELEKVKTTAKKPRKKKSNNLAVAAGVIAVASIAWLILGNNKGKQDDNTIVENTPVEKVQKRTTRISSDLRPGVPYNIPTLTLDPIKEDSDTELTEFSDE